MLLLTRHVLYRETCTHVTRNQPYAFKMGGDLNARNPTKYILNGSVGSIDTVEIVYNDVGYNDEPDITTE